ncbi:hypothetical protein B0H15DRAFT_1027965 [Mycena belliarum]|uniref:Uncharacterized protein n=1 Tax=Mycena belliarum TaxID=1033014 RepID=A0AAD6TKX8_9AGAR|nr:hypothetical protein B0H15DRAFT_1027965 [Mycena belliae]
MSSSLPRILEKSMSFFQLSGSRNPLDPDWKRDATGNRDIGSASRCHPRARPLRATPATHAPRPTHRRDALAAPVHPRPSAEDRRRPRPRDADTPPAFADALAPALADLRRTPRPLHVVPRRTAASPLTHVRPLGAGLSAGRRRRARRPINALDARRGHRTTGARRGLGGISCPIARAPSRGEIASTGALGPDSGGFPRVPTRSPAPLAPLAVPTLRAHAFLNARASGPMCGRVHDWRVPAASASARSVAAGGRTRCARGAARGDDPRSGVGARGDDSEERERNLDASVNARR